MLVLASEQASCRLSKPKLVKVRNCKFDWSIRSQVAFISELESPHGPADSGPADFTGSIGHLQLRNEW